MSRLDRSFQAEASGMRPPSRGEGESALPRTARMMIKPARDPNNATLFRFSRPVSDRVRVKVTLYSFP